MAALTCIRKSDPHPFSFRIEKKGGADVIFGPAGWSTSDIMSKIWLRDNGFDMGDIDRLERILRIGSIRKDDRDFVLSMDRRLVGKQMFLGLAQKQWCANELKRIVGMEGLGFVKSSNIAGALTLWHHIKNPIVEGSKFHREWSSIDKDASDRGFIFISEFLHWKISTDPECRQDPSSCLKRYGIIIDKINY